MKPGWERKRLGEVAMIIAGQSPPGDSYNDEGNGLPFYQGKKDFTERVLGPPTKWTTEVTKRATAGDVLMSVRAPVGPVNVAADEICIGRGLAAIRAGGSVDADYLFYCLLQMEPELQGNEGAVFASINKADIEAIAFPLPPLAEQRRIVEVLDEAFAALATATANTEQALTNARELFAATATALFNHEARQADHHPLGTIAENLDGQRRPVTKRDRTPGDVPYYGASGVVDHVADHIFDEDLLLISEDGANLLARSTPIAFSISGVSWVNNHAHVLRFTKTTTQRWIERYINSISVAPWVNGMAQPKLNQRALNSIPVPMPDLQRQAAVVDRLEAFETNLSGFAEAAQQKLTLLAELRQSLLARAFAGELTKQIDTATVRVANDNFTTPGFAANVIALTFRQHEEAGHERTFGRVKAQKSLHLVEDLGAIDMGRRPIKDAAGPNDFDHMLRAEEWARANQFFAFEPRTGGYDFCKLANWDTMLASAQQENAALGNALTTAVRLIVAMTSRQAELLVTVRAAWNNLLLDGFHATDDAILRAAREDWHSDKEVIPRREFRWALDEVRARGLVPDGSGKRVGGQERLF